MTKYKPIFLKTHGMGEALKEYFECRGYHFRGGNTPEDHKFLILGAFDENPTTEMGASDDPSLWNDDGGRVVGFEEFCKGVQTKEPEKMITVKGKEYSEDSVDMMIRAYVNGKGE